MAELDEAAVFQLRQEVLLRDLSDKLEERVKKRFSGILIAVAAASFFGIQGIASLFIHQQLNPEIDEAKDTTARLNAEADILVRHSAELVDDAENAKLEFQDAFRDLEALTTTLQANLDVALGRISELEDSMTTTEQLRLNIEANLKRLKTEVELGVEEFTAEKLEELTSDPNLEGYFDLATLGNDIERRGREIAEAEQKLLEREKALQGLADEEADSIQYEIFEKFVRLSVLIDEYNADVERYNARVTELRGEDAKPDTQVEEEKSD
ncbi:MAG: hypothetical protein AAGJ84_12475 [Pseudomonadota bacterium]